jgi:N-acyl-phosphatidylethanolamine-hydrolysing phospholipase D
MRDLIVLCAVLALAIPTPVAAKDLDLGPAPREPDGRFLNEAGRLRRAGVRVTLPFVLRRAAGRFRRRSGAPERVPNNGVFLRENARHSIPTVTWIGHATLLIQMGGLSFLTDPIWSKTASPISWLGPRRFVDPGIALDALPPIDFVVISHNHYDHLDLRTLERLAERSQATRFLVPLGNAKLLRDQGIQTVDELDWGERVSIGELSVHCLPAQHWSRRGVRDARRALWASWAVVGPERRFYFGGDTGYFSGFTRIGAALGPFDLAALPIGAYEPEAMMRVFHLNPEEALRAALDLRTRRVVGVHFGTFELTDEPLDEPPRRFRAAAQGARLASDDVWVLRVGETRDF